MNKLEHHKNFLSKLSSINFVSNIIDDRVDDTMINLFRLYAQSVARTHIPKEQIELGHINQISTVLLTGYLLHTEEVRYELEKLYERED